MERLQSKVYCNFIRIRKALVNTFTNLTKNSALHGFKYIGDQGISVCERLFFLLFCIAIFIYVVVLSTDIYATWESTPFIVGMKSSPILIHKHPFPAVTICNVNQVRASKVTNITRNSVEYSMLQTLCSGSIDGMDPSEFEEIKNRSLFQNFIEETAQPCDKLLLSCKFGTIVKSCADIFKPILTDGGQCCVFNSLHPSFIYRTLKEFEGFIQLDGAAGVDWDPEKGYQANLPKLFYPRVAFGIGISMGLSIVINAEVEDYYCTSRNGPGFKLLLHNPMEIHSLRENGLYVETGSEVNFRIAVDRSEASQDLRDLTMEKRQCTFKTERKLKYFKTYSRRNCEIECLVEKTAKYCGCISYFLPKTWTFLPACSLKDLPCQQFRQQKCKDQCMQGCFDLSYNPTKFRIPLTAGGYMLGNRMLEKMNTSYLRDNIAVVHFYYKFSDFAGLMRTSYGGVTEFLSKTGGLIGLLGLSFISSAEILYFLCLKPIGNLISWLRKRSSNMNLLQIKQPSDAGGKMVTLTFADSHQDQDMRNLGILDARNLNHLHLFQRNSRT